MRDTTAAAAHVVKCLLVVRHTNMKRYAEATHHAGCGGSLLRLEVDGLVLAAVHALLLNARQLDAEYS
jgi:hypothetical protein